MSLMTREEWLEELVTVDEEGGSPHHQHLLGVANLPLTLMPRSKVFALRDYNDDVIAGMWKIYLRYSDDNLIENKELI